MKNAILLIVGILLTVDVGGQVSDWNVKLDFNQVCNYDYDVNQQTGPTVTGLNTFKITTNQYGTGKIIFLSDVHNVYMNTQKNVFTIDRSIYAQYSNGGDYAIFYCQNEYGETTITVDFKKKKGSVLNGVGNG